jgi:hypothetical protein
MEKDPENDVAMSDITNHYDISPLANLNPKTKRPRLQEDT